MDQETIIKYIIRYNVKMENSSKYSNLQKL